MELSDCITEGLYLGGILCALNENDLADKDITHILSVDESPLPEAITKKVTYKHVCVFDLSGSDLLSTFPETFVFIEQARNSGGHVLVHCQAGLSRSATVVCAYLMQKMSSTKDKALEMIAASRPKIRPNDGFMEQLDLFHVMGCQLVKTHPLYRSFRLSKLVDGFQSGQFSTGSPEMEVLSEVLLDTDFSTQSNDAYYKCRKCRFILFRHGAVTSHTTGKGESAFDWRGSGPSKHSVGQVPMEEHEPCQRSLFVDPLMWMKGKINTTCGKLHCPKCDMKIGSFVWYGEKCPCGTWVAPAFHIDSGKVDKIPFQTVAPSARMPRGAMTSALPREATATPQSTTPLPDRGWSRDNPHNMSSGLGFPSSNTRGLSAKSNAPVVAAVAPLVSASSSGGSGDSRLVDSSRMEIEGEVAVPSSTRNPTVGHAAMFSNPSISGLHNDSNAQMDVDS